MVTLRARPHAREPEGASFNASRPIWLWATLCFQPAAKLRIYLLQLSRTTPFMTAFIKSAAAKHQQLPSQLPSSPSTIPYHQPSNGTSRRGQTCPEPRDKAATAESQTSPQAPSRDIQEVLKFYDRAIIPKEKVCPFSNSSRRNPCTTHTSPRKRKDVIQTSSSD